MKKPCLLFVAISASTALAQQVPDTGRNFVSCPIVRDTSTVPCWLAEYQGELYYLGIQTDVSAEFHPPFLGHQVIVEGVVSEQASICGGIVLDPVKISVVEELDANCNTILPAEDRYPIDFNPRPPGPSAGRLSFQGAAGSPPIPEPTVVNDEFTLYHDFNGAIAGKLAGPLNAIFQHAAKISARTLIITGHQGDVLLSDGSVLRERAGVAEKRARDTANVLLGAGIAIDDVRIEWEAPIAPDGNEDWRNRSTTVRLLP